MGPIDAQPGLGPRLLSRLARARAVENSLARTRLEPPDCACCICCEIRCFSAGRRDGRNPSTLPKLKENSTLGSAHGDGVMLQILQQSRIWGCSINGS